MQQDISGHDPQIEELRALVAELDTDSPEPKHALADIEERDAKAKKRADEVVEMLDEAYTGHQAYRQALQEAEKWVMAMSFKLITFNALNVGTLELTKQQIEKQKVN